MTNCFWVQVIFNLYPGGFNLFIIVCFVIIKLDNKQFNILKDIKYYLILKSW
jgi:hypothetical protein